MSTEPPETAPADEPLSSQHKSFMPDDPTRDALSRDNPESRWHEEQRTPSHRKSWACIPLTDAVNAVVTAQGLVDRFDRFADEVNDFSASAAYHVASYMLRAALATPPTSEPRFSQSPDVPWTDRTLHYVAPEPLAHRIIPAMVSGHMRQPPTCVNCGALLTSDGSAHV